MVILEGSNTLYANETKAKTHENGPVYWEFSGYPGRCMGSPGNSHAKKDAKEAPKRCQKATLRGAKEAPTPQKSTPLFMSRSLYILIYVPLSLYT